MGKLIVVKPVPLTAANLIATDVPEADYPEIVNGHGYVLNDRVISTLTHKVYQCVLPYNAATPAVPPQDDPTHWQRVGPTNRWKAWDTSSTTQTAQASSMTYQIRPGQAVNSLALLNLAGCSAVHVWQHDPAEVDPDVNVYDQTYTLTGSMSESTWWAWFFGTRRPEKQLLVLDLLPNPSADLYVTLIGGTDLAVGVIVVGVQQEIGDVVGVAKPQIRDYSTKETDDFGETVFVERAYAKAAKLQVLVPAMNFDAVYDFLADVRAKPSLYIASRLWTSLVIFGWYTNFDPDVSGTVITPLEMDIEGLT